MQFIETDRRKAQILDVSGARAIEAKEDLLVIGVKITIQTMLGRLGIMTKISVV